MVAELITRIGSVERRVLYLAAVLLLVALGTIRIVSTYKVFSATVDEPVQIAAGMLWLEQKQYIYDHPPLARMAAALPLYIAGLRSPREIPSSNDLRSAGKVGDELLRNGGGYAQNLSLARLGILPFFLIACLVIWLWSNKIFSRQASFMALLFFTTTPPVLAHSGLATTDMAAAATITAAVYSFYLWLETPNMFRSLLLGILVGLSVLAKSSSLVFLTACFLLAIGICLLTAKQEPERLPHKTYISIKSLGLCCAAVFLVIWAGFRFSVSPLKTPEVRPHVRFDHYFGTEGAAHDLAYLIAEAPIPARDLIRGVRYQWDYNADGPYGYLLGEIRKGGWWYFFPVALTVKTPIPFLIFYGLGLLLLIRQQAGPNSWQRWVPALCSIGILLVCLPARINIGLRHILPIYPFLAIMAGFGAARFVEVNRRSKAVFCAVAILLLWQLTSSAFAHPDYLAYFNELGRSEPERILVDSDLDWGQDLYRLKETLKQLKVDSVSIAYFGATDLNRHGLPNWKPLLPNVPATGWIAISLFRLKMYATAPGSGQVFNGYSWLERWQPVTMVGKSMRLYYVPPPTNMGQNIATTRGD